MRCYEELGILGQRVRYRLESVLPHAGVYPRPRVALRLAQRILDLIHVDYLRARRDGIIVADTESALLGGLHVELKTGAVRPSLRTLLRRLGSFARFWIYSLLNVPRAGMGRAGAVTLILGLRQRDIVHSGSARDFLAFCSEGRVAPLAEAVCFVVQDTVPEPHAEARLSVGRSGLLRAMRVASRSGLMAFLGEHLTAAVRYLTCTIQSPVFCLLDRDFAEQAMADSLNRAGALKDVVVTNTWFAEQPLWATDLPGRGFRTHMVLYSMMGRAFAYADIPATPPPTLPGFGLMRADLFWVWTSGQAQMLRELGVPGEIRVAGPLVWRPRHRASGRGRGIALFDVTPAVPDVADRLGLAYNYYSVTTCGDFLDHVVATARALEAETGRPVPVLLKHKRPFASLHDRQYIDQVASLCEQGVVRGVDPDIDPYELLEQAFAAVVMPFSSPAYLASDAGIPSVYYDPTGMLLPTFEKADGISFARNRTELAAFLRSALDAASRRQGA
jgi:hypothetical protein